MKCLRIGTVLFVFALGLPLGPQVQAATMVFDNRDNFRAAAGALTIQDFNGDFTQDATNSTPLDFDGFRVEETQGTPNLHKFSFQSFEFLHFQSDDPSTIRFSFDQAITAFGLTTIDFAREDGLADGVFETITFLDDSPGSSSQVVLSRISGGSVGVTNFFGVINDTPFRVVELTFSTGTIDQMPGDGDDVGLEDLEFAVVPLPASLILMVSGVLGIGAFSRRR